MAVRTPPATFVSYFLFRSADVVIDPKVNYASDAAIDDRILRMNVKEHVGDESLEVAEVVALEGIRFRHIVRRAEERHREAVDAFRAADGPQLLGLPNV